MGRGGLLSVALVAALAGCTYEPYVQDPAPPGGAEGAPFAEVLSVEGQEGGCRDAGADGVACHRILLQISNNDPAAELEILAQDFVVRTETGAEARPAEAEAPPVLPPGEEALVRLGWELDEGDLLVALRWTPRDWAAYDLDLPPYTLRGGVAGVRIAVLAASTTPGGCAFPEDRSLACHSFEVHLENDNPSESADTSAFRWGALTTAGERREAVESDGRSRVPPFAETDVRVVVETTARERLATVVYRDGWMPRDAQADVPTT